MGGDGSSECVRVEAAEPGYDYLANDVFVVKVRRCRLTLSNPR
jgi:hypothetical protein